MSFSAALVEPQLSQCAGKGLYLILVSWLYALYSFDYRWGLSRKHLQQRVAFFQQHWAFFLGERPSTFPLNPLFYSSLWLQVRHVTIISGRPADDLPLQNDWLCPVAYRLWVRVHHCHLLMAILQAGCHHEHGLPSVHPGGLQV